MAAIIPAALILLKGIDYGWTAWDMAQAAWTLGDPCSTQEDRFWAGLTIALAAGIEMVEPDDLLPISLPLDDIVRRQLMHELREEGIESVAQRLRQELGDEAAEKVLRISSTKGKTMPYEVGIVEDLLKRSTPGDKLDIHHAPQQHLAKQVIAGYDPKTGPGIAIPYGEHKATPTHKGFYTGTPRDLLAETLWELRRNTGVPNKALEDLVALVRCLYPGVFDK